MGYVEICRIAGGTLVFLIGLALGFAGAQLWTGGPAAWPDIIANDVIVRRSACILIIMAALLAITGIAAFRGAWWGNAAAAVALIIFVTVAFWGNYVLFGDIRPLHTGTNVVVGVIILALLWVGSPR
jgi:hypothetical protein